MKLLFDQNISFRIVAKINSIFPNSKQVRQVKLEDIKDTLIWKFAKENDFTIVTFDSNFSDIANLQGHPPKIIWLRGGNMTTNSIAELLKVHQENIRQFIENKEFESISVIEIE